LYHPGQLFSASNEKKEKRTRTRLPTSPLLIYYVLGFVILHQDRKKKQKGKEKTQRKTPTLNLPTKLPTFPCAVCLVMVVVFRGW
jgi:hypothetical protein